MSLSEIQRSVNSLKRRLALPIAVIRMRRVVDDVCDQWGAAQAGGKPLPRPFQVVTLGPSRRLSPRRTYGSWPVHPALPR